MSGPVDVEELGEVRSLGSHFSMRLRLSFLGVSFWAYGGLVLASRGFVFPFESVLVVGSMLGLGIALAAVLFSRGSSRKGWLYPGSGTGIDRVSSARLNRLLFLSLLSVFLFVVLLLLPEVHRRTFLLFGLIPIMFTRYLGFLLVLSGCTIGVFSVFSRARERSSWRGTSTWSLLLLGVGVACYALSILDFEALLWDAAARDIGIFAHLDLVAFCCWIFFCVGMFWWNNRRWRNLSYLCGLCFVGLSILILVSGGIAHLDGSRSYLDPENFGTPMTLNEIGVFFVPFSRTALLYLLLFLVPLFLRGSMVINNPNESGMEEWFAIAGLLVPSIVLTGFLAITSIEGIALGFSQNMVFAAILLCAAGLLAGVSGSDHSRRIRGRRLGLLGLSVALSLFSVSFVFAWLIPGAYMIGSVFHPYSVIISPVFVMAASVLIMGAGITVATLIRPFWRTGFVRPFRERDSGRDLPLLIIICSAMGISGALLIAPAMSILILSRPWTFIASAPPLYVLGRSVYFGIPQIIITITGIIAAKRLHNLMQPSENE